MTQRFHLVPALAAVLLLTAAPAVGQAAHPRRDHGLYVKLGHGGGFVFGYQRHHAHVDHYRAYRRVERELLEKRSRLLRHTQRALGEEDFAKTRRLLARLLDVDQELGKHREHHRGCGH